MAEITLSSLGLRGVFIVGAKAYHADGPGGGWGVGDFEKKVEKDELAEERGVVLEPVCWSDAVCDMSRSLSLPKTWCSRALRSDSSSMDRRTACGA
jgi:hypothetical protein